MNGADVAAGAGDSVEADFGAWAEEVRPRLFRFFLRVSRDYELAADLPQEVLLRIWRTYAMPRATATDAASPTEELVPRREGDHSEEVPPGGAESVAADRADPSLWRRVMWTVARNVWFDHLDLIRRRPTQPLDEGAEPLDDGRDAEAARVDLLDLAPHLAKLPLLLRQALLLRANDYSRQQIATYLHCTPERVHQLLKVARRRLRLGSAGR